MKKLYMLLDNELRMCIVVDRCVVFYKEYDYTESILDQLYSKISAHNVDSAVVITKGILSFQSFAESYKVFQFKIKENEHSCYVSKFDVNKVVNLLNTAGVMNVRVLDKFGYYVSLAKQDCCMIDTLGNAYSVITFRDKIRDISYNSYQNLERILINCNKKFAVESFIDMTTYYDERYIHYFKNVETLLNQLENAMAEENSGEIKNLVRTLTTLSVFAYSELKISHYFELDQSKINLVNANPIRKEDDYENDELNDNLDEDYTEQKIPEVKEEASTTVEEKQAEPKKEKKKQKKEKVKSTSKPKKEKKPASKARTAVNVAGILLSIGMLGATYYCANASVTYTEQIGTLSSQNEEILTSIDDANVMLSDYQGFSRNLGEFTNYTDLYNALAKISYGNDVKTVSYEDGVMKAELYVKDTTKVQDTTKTEKSSKDNKDKSKEVTQPADTKDSITKRLKKDLGKKFEVQQLTEEKCNRDGYLLYSVYLAKK